VSSSRQLRRLESTTRSSIYANFGETIQGLSSIRAYNVQQRFIDMSDHLIDRNQSCTFANSAASTYDLFFSNTFKASSIFVTIINHKDRIECLYSSVDY
jgi:ABC-type multidrug transport system fused ATPase/permease subunit